VIATGVARLGTQHVVYGAGHGNASGVRDRILDCTNTIVVTDSDVGPITITLAAQFILAPPN
jgi:acyl-coenzyme A synthetase/AMP-(fatty) acid ligase